MTTCCKYIEKQQMSKKQCINSLQKLVGQIMSSYKLQIVWKGYVKNTFNLFIFYKAHANTNKEIVNANICSKITKSQQRLKSKLSNNHK